jgi:hypothetical protein
MRKGMTTHEMMAFISAILFAIGGAEWGMRLGCFFAILFGVVGIFLGFVVGFVWVDALDKLAGIAERANLPWLRVVLFVCAVVVMIALYYGLLIFLGYPMRMRHRSHTAPTNPPSADHAAGFFTSG